MAFLKSYYNFSLPENQPAGATLGKVQASSGSDLYSVSYSLRNHNDLFSVDTNGNLQAKAPLDKEQQGMYILEVEAEDTRSPPTSDVAIVRPGPVKNNNFNSRKKAADLQSSVFSFGPCLFCCQGGQGLNKIT